MNSWKTESVIYQTAQFIYENSKLKEIFYNRIIKKYEYDGYFNTSKLHQLPLKDKEYDFTTELNRIEKNIRLSKPDEYFIRRIISAIVFYSSIENKDDAINEFVKILINNFSNFEKCEYDKQNPYYIKRSDIQIKQINSLNDYINNLTDIKIEPDSELFFRGHSDVNFILLPSIFREECTYKNEQFFYNSITRLCPKEFERFRNHIDQLVEMQHYELPTRLLDITKNALVALLFACIDNENTDAEVICFAESNTKIKYGQSHTLAVLACLASLSYEQKVELFDLVDSFGNNINGFNAHPVVQCLLQEIKSEKGGFKDQIKPKDLRKTILALPALNNNRIIKQSGAFFIGGLIENSDAKNIAEDLNQKRLKTNISIPIFIINHEQKKSIAKQLEICDITEATLFPEIDAVARYLKKHY